MTKTDNSLGPIPADAIPKLQPYNGKPPTIPKIFMCKALLHPFAPPPDASTHSPFYQLCTANIHCVLGETMIIHLTGCEYGTWWYEITAAGTRLSTDQGSNWSNVDMGWSLPEANWFGSETPTTAGQGPLNWMQAQNCSWWKGQVPGTSASLPGATWFWFDTESAGQNIPVRCMFGVQPPKPDKGDPKQLALFQNFSFSYFDDFQILEHLEEPGELQDDPIQGFTAGNPEGYPLFEWQPNLGITALMTPVNEKFNPLPTRVLYRWDDDAEFQNGGTRGQNTLLHYDNPNANNYSFELAMLLRESPDNKANGYNAYYDLNGNIDKKTSGAFPFGTEPPNWPTLGQGEIKATISNNKTWSPDNPITIVSVMFPPAKNYPQGTYLWTWYSPTDGPSSTNSRPVTFMQSESKLGKGTSLALADYFYFDVYQSKVDACHFQIPVPEHVSI